MKNLNNLSQKLEKLQSQKKTFNSINNISLAQFIQFKRILSKEKKINKKMENVISLGNEINFWYDSKTKSWIENPNINCRKYYKMEKNAAYKKNLKLYKLGLCEKRPLPPIILSLKAFFKPITIFLKQQFENLKPVLSKYNFFKKIHQKFNYFKSYTLPKNINKLAVNTASIGIKGYRHLRSNCRYIRSNIVSKDSFKYLKNVINEANRKVDNYEKSLSFRDSLKIENFKSMDQNDPTTSIPQKISKEFYEYSL